MLREVIGYELEGLFGSLFGELSQSLEDDGDDGAVQVLANGHRFEVFSLHLINCVLIMALFGRGYCKVD